MKKFLKGYTLVGNKVCYYLSFFSMFTIVVMMVLITIDVLLSHILNYRIPGCYEVSQVLLSTLVFSSWAYTQTVHGHIHVVMFISKMPQKLRFVCFSLTSIFSTVTLAVAAYAVWIRLFEVMESNERTGTLLIPYWPFYIFEFLAMALLAIVLLRDAIKAVYAIADKETAEEIQTTWV